jgi:catechol 2,3-dioxygenase-like lactoylglutathione lyase family enzyme
MNQIPGGLSSFFQPRFTSKQGQYLAFIFAYTQVKYQGPVSHFAPVRVNETLTLDFDTAVKFEEHHYAFKVDEQEFDAIFERIRGEKVPYGSGPRSPDDMQINRRHGGRGVYFLDPNGHLLEVLTA